VVGPGPRVTNPASSRIDARTATCTAAALVAFAGNSVLCRLALGQNAIDPATFSTVRLAGGAGMLLATTAIQPKGRTAPQGSWISAVVLFVYAIPFSFAYTRLTAGTGALILFGAVQVTMMIAAITAGERPHASQWIGLVLALCGLVYLVLPGLRAPSLFGSALMTLAGIMWGVYSLRGRGAPDALQLNMTNFTRALPLALMVSVIAWSRLHITPAGLGLALICGAITSGLGYVLWYAALRNLSAARAAIVQLIVPVLAGVGGVAFLGETISLRLALSAAVTLGGIALALTGGKRFG
jgi:drug/metabolite transporter (DMT)-like permease